MKLIYTNKNGRILVTSKLLNSPIAILRGYIKISPGFVNKKISHCLIGNGGMTASLRWDDGSSTKHRVQLIQPVLSQGSSVHHN